MTASKLPSNSGRMYSLPGRDFAYGKMLAAAGPKIPQHRSPQTSDDVCKASVVCSEGWRHAHKESSERPSKEAKQSPFSKLSNAMTSFALKARHMLVHDDEWLRATQRAKWKQESEQVREQIVSASSFQKSSLLERRDKPLLTVIPPRIIDGVDTKYKATRVYKISMCSKPKEEWSKDTDTQPIPSETRSVPCEDDELSGSLKFHRNSTSESGISTSLDSKASPEAWSRELSCDDYSDSDTEVCSL